MTEHDLPDGMDQLRQDVHEAAEKAPLQARQVARAEVRRVWKWAVLACFLVSAMVALATGVAVLNLHARAASTDAAVAALRQQAEQSKAKGDQANAELAQRGQAPVPIPEPGKVDDGEVIIAAATARVLASLPTPQPSTADLGQALARYLAANPLAPQLRHLSSSPPPWLGTSRPTRRQLGRPAPAATLASEDHRARTVSRARTGTPRAGTRSRPPSSSTSKPTPAPCARAAGPSRGCASSSPTAEQPTRGSAS